MLGLTMCSFGSPLYQPPWIILFAPSTYCCTAHYTTQIFPHKFRFWQFCCAYFSVGIYSFRPFFGPWAWLDKGFGAWLGLNIEEILKKYKNTIYVSTGMGFSQQLVTLHDSFIYYYSSCQHDSVLQSAVCKSFKERLVSSNLLMGYEPRLRIYLYVVVSLLLY